MSEITDFKICVSNKVLNETLGIPAGDDDCAIFEGAEIEGYLMERNGEAHFKVTQNGVEEFLIPAIMVEKIIF